jgi:hypothetical protein
VFGKRIDGSKLKKQLYNEGLKKPICELCGQDEIWQGKKMSLILDHINGVNIDNRLENLRIVCPNCDATLDTFCSKNRTKVLKVKKERPTKKVSLTQLYMDLESEKSYVAVGKKYGVSDNAIRKWFKSYNVEPPKRK